MIQRKSSRPGGRRLPRGRTTTWLLIACMRLGAVVAAIAAAPAHAGDWGLTHFENHVVGIAALPQAVDWSVDDYGMFLQMSLKFGPYPVIEVH